MRSDAVFRFDNTFDVYDQITTQDPLSGEFIYEYEFNRSMTGLVLPGAQGQVYLATRDGIELKSSIRNAKDRNGTAIFSIGSAEFEMFVTDALPQYDTFGSVVGWRHVLKRSLPREIDLSLLTDRLGEIVGEEVG